MLEFKMIQELEKLQEDYFVFSNTKISNGEYDNATLTIYNELIKQNFYANGIMTRRNSDKINYLIDMIKDKNIENKLRLAICKCR